jgi:hypothetical protein
MAGGNKIFQFLSTLIIVFILCLSLISIVFELSGMLFFVEFILLVLFFIISAMIVMNVYGDNKWAKHASLIFFSVNLLNLAGLFFIISLRELVLPGIVSVLGLLISFSGEKRKELTCEIKPRNEIDIPAVEKGYQKKKRKTPKKSNKKKTAKRKRRR